MQMYNLSPIVLFVYNRPHHTQKTLDALAANPEAENSELYIYCDGAKSTASSEDIKNIEEVRRIVKGETRFNTVNIIVQEKNKGLASSIVNGVTEVVSKYNRVIVLEDDIVTSPFFLKYMNTALGLYENEKKVACITGYVFPAKDTLPETFFLKGAECWGWATWERSWNQFENKGEQLLTELEKQKKQYEFDYNGTYPHYQMLTDRVEGKNKSWAICWYAMAFLKDMLTLYPAVSLVRNIGFDGSGEHCGDQPEDTAVSDREIDVKYISPQESEKARLIVANYFSTREKKSNSLKNLFNRILNNNRIKYLKNRLKHGGLKNYKNFTHWNDHKELLDTWGEGNVWTEFKKYTKDWKGRVLDIGCGTGSVLQNLKLQNSNVQILGIEPGEQLVKQSMNNGILSDEFICTTFSQFLQKNNKYETDYVYSIAALQYFNLTELKELVDFIKTNVNKQAVFFLPASNDNIDHGIYLSWQTYNRVSEKWWQSLFSRDLNEFKMETERSDWKDAECYGIWITLTREI